jgi:hypothetical protein
LEGEGKVVHEDSRPLVLVVCGEKGRLERTRTMLRAAGMLAAAGRSVAASLALLTQVQFDACVVAQAITAREADELRATLARYSPGCLSLQVPTAQGEELAGWRPCAEEALASAISDALMAGTSHR